MPTALAPSGPPEQGRRGVLAATQHNPVLGIMGAAQQLPLRLAGSHAAAQEPPGALLFFDLAEHRLDGLPTFGVASLARWLASLAFMAVGGRRFWTPTACRPCGACPGGRAWPAG